MIDFFDEAIKAGMGASAKALKPCPFCGSQQTGLHQETTAGGEFIMYIECHACGARGSVKRFPMLQFADIKSTWNDRAGNFLDEYIFRGGTLREWVGKIERGEVRAERHGRWIWDSNAPHREHGAYKCSNCGCHSNFEDNYCYDCGAKMDWWK